MEDDVGLLDDDDLPPDVHAMAAYYADGSEEDALAEVFVLAVTYIFDAV